MHHGLQGLQERPRGGDLGTQQSSKKSALLEWSELKAQCLSRNGRKTRSGLDFHPVPGRLVPMLTEPQTR